MSFPHPSNHLGPTHPGKAPFRLDWQDSACLLMGETPDGWAGLYCFQGKETPEETASFLNRHYPDGLAGLSPLGDLITLGERPEACERMDEDGDYEPARDPGYPPDPWPDFDEALDLWTAIHGVVDFAVRWREESGWEAVLFGGRLLTE